MDGPNLDRIPFIDAYCDRWCDRCKFTLRCGSYAVEIATEMCGGDFEAGLLLATAARSTDPAEEAQRLERIARYEEFLAQMTPAAEAEIERAEQASRERVERSDISAAGWNYFECAQAWFVAHPDVVPRARDPHVVEAVDVLRWDQHLIPPKVNRAVSGFEDCRHGDDVTEDLIQNDWNGSAKVALISIERSLHAWHLIAEATGDPGIAEVEFALRELHTLMQRTFPDAWKFVRPGFDQNC